jgi:hypothetical protein
MLMKTVRLETSFHQRILTLLITSHISSSQLSVSGGHSGMKTKSAPPLVERSAMSQVTVSSTYQTPAMRANQPQWRPMTSITNALECELAVVLMLSIDSQIR